MGAESKPAPKPGGREQLAIPVVLAASQGICNQAQGFLLFLNLFFKHFIHFQRQGKGGRKRERNTNWLPLAHSQLMTWPTMRAHAQTGNRTDDLLILRPALYPLSHTSQGSATGFLDVKFFRVCSL